MGKTDILGVPFQKVTMAAALDLITAYVESGRSHLVVTANPETVMIAQQDQLFLEILGRADLVVADGIGIVWASRVLGQALPGRIPGIELAAGVLGRAAEKGWRVFFLGGAPGIASQAAWNMARAWPGLNIAGTHHGYFPSGTPEQAVLEKIKKSRPQILLAALGVPRQEKWLAAHLGVLKTPVAIGVGGSFNVWAGVDKRAPHWLRRLHLEWFYRLLKQPRRIWRVAVLPKYVFLVWLTRLRRRGLKE